MTSRREFLEIRAAAAIGASIATILGACARG